MGGASGIVRSQTPTLFAIASGIQCTALGSTFWASRTALLQAWNANGESPSDLTKASGVAGGVSGGVIGLIFRGPRNVIPGTIVMGCFGAGGQAIYNSWRLRREERANVPKQGFLESLSKKKWSPVRSLSDEEYANILREKALRVEVEIAVLDDKIAALRKQESEESITVPADDEE